jgi:adenine-specific DNA-methyltransferase
MVELIWDGKYDKDGKRTAPPRLKLPFQTVETINESAQQRQMSLDLFSAGRPNEWRNRLIWGDKKYVLPALLDELTGKVDLIYIDPPFNVGADFSYTAEIPDYSETEEDETSTFLREPSIIEQKAYRDTWGKGLNSYLQWFYETVVLLRELLSDNGSVYVHLDWHVGHYAKSVMDEVFGMENFRNEVIWKRSAIATNVNTQWRNSHDVLMFYTKGQKSKFITQYGEYSESSKEHFSYEDETGVYSLVPLLGSGRTAKGETGQVWHGIDPGTIGKDGMHWLKKPSALEQLNKEGKIYWPTKKGGLPRLKYYLHEAKGRYVSDVWDDISVINSMAGESAGYPTQKPELLLERVIKASTNENDLILDCFCGSGTTAAVAEKLNRRWVACDLGRFAIHTTRKRLLSIPDVKPFMVQNLGKYERQAWQAAEFGGEKKAAAMVNQYRRFILDLYNARAIEGYTWLHGIKDGRMIHVGPVDSPISPNDVTQIAIEFKKAMGTGKDAPAIAAVDVLGWDFAFELNEIAAQQAGQAGIRVKFMRIPREVLESKAVEQGDIRFFELAALSVDVHKKGKEVTLTLKDFVIPPDDVPAEVQKAITHWSQWIDYWSVDWDNKDDTFHNMWQTYRTRQDKTLKLKGSHVYDESGEYTIMVKVIDILGNDTTKALKVKVP